MRWHQLSGKCVASAITLGRVFDAAIMPQRCVFCGTASEPGEVYCCCGCAAELPWVENRCARCAIPVATPLRDGVDCANCQQCPPPFIAAATPLRYTFPIDAAIKAMKFRRRLYYVPAFSPMLMKTMACLPKDVDALLAVPLHWRRHATRGFNQAVELCKPLQKLTGLPMLANVKRIRSTPYQSGLDADERRRNLRAAFAIQGSVIARHVLIVDDVITTGETCRQLANVVLAAGAQKVSVLAIARA